MPISASPLTRRGRSTLAVRCSFLQALAIVLVPGCPIISSAGAADTPVHGRWDLNVEGGPMRYAAWLEVDAAGLPNTVRFVGRVASVRDIRQFTLTGDSLKFVHDEYFSPYEKCSHEFVVDGDRVTGTITRANGAALAVTGRRAPTLERPAPPSWNDAKPIFSGVDFSGWQAIYGASPSSSWRIENNELITFKSGTPVRTVAVFDDFRLHLEFNCPAGANSGIYLRGRYEVQIEDDSASAPTNQQTGGIYGWLGPTALQPRGSGRWRTLDVTLVGRRASVVLDGVTLYKDSEIPGITGEALDSDEGAPGPIILQASHAKDGGELRFRNITISTPLR